jgi:DNA-directed RNA polymerase subunit RPC12/RpoP
MSHRWVLLSKSETKRYAVCQNCLADRREKQNSDGWLTTYTIAMGSFRHTPECKKRLKHHTWNLESNTPWLECKHCGTLKVVTLRDDDSIVVFMKPLGGSWMNDYFPCEG